MESHETDCQVTDHNSHAEWYFPPFAEIGIPTFSEDTCGSSDVIYDVYKAHFPEMTQVTSGGLPAPLDAASEADVVGLGRHRRVIHSPGLQLDAIRYGASKRRLDPYSPTCMVPLPDHFGEPCFIRRRNERERERVRCVNEGYSRLKDHLPFEGKEKRMSKVDTLRGAINYIRQLQRLLDNDSNNKNNNNNSNNKDNSSNSKSNSNSKVAHTGRRIDVKASHYKKRTSSLSSSEPDSPDSFT